MQQSSTKWPLFGTVDHTENNEFLRELDIRNRGFPPARCSEGNQGKLRN
jgi:hypothetical protein